jgi:hypothetical protein
MTALVINGDTSGSITLQAPAAAGAGTVLTLPAVTGTVLNSGGGTTPAFMGYPPASNQSITNNVWTKVTLSNTTWSVGTTYGYSTTNSRFTAPVAGYYMFLGSAYFASSTNMTTAKLALYLNGSAQAYGPFPSGNIAATDALATVSNMMQLAAGDYVELYAVTAGGTGQVVVQYSSYTYLQGMFVRGNAV